MVFSSLRNKLSSKTANVHVSASPARGVEHAAPNALFGGSPFPGFGRQGDAPPAYTPTASPLSFNTGGEARPLNNITNDDDKYAFLSTFDTIFLVDDSGSMAGSLWTEVAAALSSITPICTAHDSDGIDLYFLNHRSGLNSYGNGNKASGGYYNITSPDMVERIFRDVRPYGTTPTGSRLQAILRPYLASLANSNDVDQVKPVNIIVITDGRPTDDPESILVQSARKLDQLEAPPHQVGVQFFQIGNEKGAKEALRELDDDLVEQGIRDMVDAVTWDSTTSARNKVLSADGILKVVLGAVIRRLDRKPTPSRKERSRRNSKRSVPRCYQSSAMF